MNILVLCLVDVNTHFHSVNTQRENCWVTEICIFSLITTKHFSKVILICISLMINDILFCLHIFWLSFNWVVCFLLIVCVCVWDIS